MQQRTAKYSEKWKNKKEALEKEKEDKLASELTFTP